MLPSYGSVLCAEYRSYETTQMEGTTEVGSLDQLTSVLLGAGEGGVPDSSPGR